MIKLKDTDTFKVIDDLIPGLNQDRVEKLLFNGPFQWYGQWDTDGHILTHTFMWDSEEQSKFIMNLDNIFLAYLGGQENLLRCQSVMSYPGGKTSRHTDFIDKPYYTFIYYVNDCDGDLILYNSDKTIMTKIAPKKGRAVMFKGDIEYEDTRPSTDIKVILRLNYAN